MSAEATAWCWRQRGMKAAEHHVLLALAEHAHPDGTSAYPSLARLAAMTNYSERSITRILAALVESKMIDVEIPYGWLQNGRQMPTSYRLRVFGDRVAKMATPPNGVDRMAGPGSQDDREAVANLATEPRTGTNNGNLTTSAAVPPSAVVDPIKAEAKKITAAWWESFAPQKPIGKYIGFEQIVERLLRAEWPPAAVAAAASDCGMTLTAARMQASLTKSRGRTVSYTAGPDTPAAVEINPAEW